MLKAFRETTIEWFGGYDYYRINYMIYVFGGVWMLDTKYVQESRRYVLLGTRLFILILNILAVVDMLYDTYLVYGDLEKLTYSLSSSAFYIGSLYRFILIIIKKDELEGCLKIMDNNFYLWDVGKSASDMEILKRGEAELRKISKLFYFLVTVCVVSRGICQLAPTKKNLMIPFPFIEPVESPHFEILFVLQTVAMIHFVTTIITHEMVVYGFFIRIVKHLEIVEKNLCQVKKVFLEEEDSWNPLEKRNQFNFSGLKRLELISYRLANRSDCDNVPIKPLNERIGISMKKIITHHQNIVNLIGRLSSLYKLSFFLQIFGGGGLIAILIMDVMWKSQALSISTIAQGLYAGSTFLNISILCYYGSRVEAKSHKAAVALYACPWLQMNVRNRKNLVIFMSGLVGSRPVRAGGIWPINLNTYVKFVQVIYTCVTFIHSLLN